MANFLHIPLPFKYLPCKLPIPQLAKIAAPEMHQVFQTYEESRKDEGPMFDAAIARGYLGDLELHAPAFGEKIRQFARNSRASLCRLLTGFHTNANAELITIPACSIEDITLLEAAFKAEYTELGKRNVDVTDELVRYSLLGIPKMD